MPQAHRHAKNLDDATPFTIATSSSTSGLGMKVSKIHRIISFKQSRWLKPYIDFNTEMRKQAKNAFEKDFFKLMNNAVFGKIMENLRKHVNVKLVTEGKKLKRMTSKPTFKSFKIFSDNVVAMHMAKKASAARQADVRGHVYPGPEQGVHVRISL
jgi:hypothetical protein